MLDKLLKDVSVVGAAGKMGSGISLLLLQEMAKEEMNKLGTLGSGEYKLHLIDIKEQAFCDLQCYLRSQLKKYAEANINSLRLFFTKEDELISNRDIIEAFVEKGMNILRLSTSVVSSKNSHLIFEAVAEDPTVKQHVYAALNHHCSPMAYYFTNTSSIPISELNDMGKLDNRIIGFHFYNPPAVQKLVELITTTEADPILVDLALDLGKRFNKTIIRSNDIAGFIGNGHLIREILFACAKARELSLDMPLMQAIYMINRVTQDYLIRPMGIFQVIDYIGINVCQCIAQVMSDHIGTSLHDKLLDIPLQFGLKGGQNPDGTQKQGFFEYDKFNPIGILNENTGKYESLKTGLWKKLCDERLGELPEGHSSWKNLVNDKSKDEKLSDYFQHLFACTSQGAELARGYLLKSREIAETLVADGVAKNIEDVNSVLENGFFHIYGPVNTYY